MSNENKDNTEVKQDLTKEFLNDRMIDIESNIQGTDGHWYNLRELLKEFMEEQVKERIEELLPDDDHISETIKSTFNLEKLTTTEFDLVTAACEALRVNIKKELG